MKGFLFLVIKTKKNPKPPKFLKYQLHGRSCCTTIKQSRLLRKRETIKSRRSTFYSLPPK